MVVTAPTSASVTTGNNAVLPIAEDAPLPEQTTQPLQIITDSFATISAPASLS